MSAWGPNIFENDNAADWIGDLYESRDFALVRAALNCVVKHGGTKYSPPSLLERLRGRKRHVDLLKAGLCYRALAAAEVLAASLGHPGAKTPERLLIWLQQCQPIKEPGLVKLAQEAVTIVKTNSELKELWEEGDTTRWKSSVEDLEQRLRISLKS